MTNHENKQQAEADGKAQVAGQAAKTMNQLEGLLGKVMSAVQSGGKRFKKKSRKRRRTRRRRKSRRGRKSRRRRRTRRRRRRRR